MNQLSANRRTILIAVVVLGLIALLIWWQQDNKPPGPPSPPLVNSIELFRKMWNSEDHPTWAVADPMAEMCEKAYQPLLNARGAFELLGFENTVEVRSESMLTYIASTDDVMVIVFRGTELGDVGDWIADLNFLSKQTKHGKMPTGFWEGYDGLRQMIVNEVKQQKPKYLWLTGHSLGGALAVVCADSIEDDSGIPVFGIMTFGQPKVADEQLAQHLNKALRGRLVHFVNNTDIVTRLPPFYFHAHSLVRFTDNGPVRFMNKGVVGDVEKQGTHIETDAELPSLSEQEFKALQNQIRARKQMRAARIGDKQVVEGFFPNPFASHPMAAYHERVREMLRKLPSK